MTVVVHLELLILVILICWFGDWICKWQLNVCCYNMNVCDIRCLFVPEHHIVRYDFRMKTMFGSSLPQVVYRRSHVLFTFVVLVCVWWCPTNVVFCFSFVFLRLVYPMLPVFLDCPFLIDPSVLSNVYVLP
jgi:hypothetical protein